MIPLRDLPHRLVPFAVCLVAAIVATWPLLPALARALPQGTEHETTVPLLNLWELWWTADRLPAGMAGFWDAPIFHPVQGAFAFSEPLILQGVALSPLWWLGVPPAAIYNLAILLTLALNGLATRDLARALGASPSASLVAGVAGVVLPYSAKVLGVLPVLPLFGTLWALGGLVRFSAKGNWRWAACAVGSFAAQFLAGQQMALLSLPFVLLAGLVAIKEQRFRLRAIATLAAFGAVAGLALSPIVRKTAEIREHYGFTRSEAVVEALSARPEDFTTRVASARLALPAREDAFRGDTGGLFPGFGWLAFGIAGGLLGWRRSSAPRAWIAFLAASVVGGALLALGLHFELFGWRPFATLRDFVPGLATLRSPFRGAAISQMLLPVLGAFALSQLELWRGRTGRAAALGLGLVAAAENLSTPGTLAATPTTPRTAWTTWLRDQPSQIVVAHVPLPGGLHVADYELDTWRMFAQIDHHQPLLNGYSGFFPSGYGAFQADMAENFPDVRLLCMMYFNLRVNTVVFDRDWFEPRRAQLENETFGPFFGRGFTDDQVVILRLRPTPALCGMASP